MLGPTSASTCADRCATTVGCVAWSFDSCGKSACWLKTSVSSSFPSNCRTSDVQGRRRERKGEGEGGTDLLTGARGRMGGMGEAGERQERGGRTNERQFQRNIINLFYFLALL